jgi:sec-independent protein translocase protein TatB
MFALSPAKMLLVFVVIMIVIGPDKLPSVARQLGAAIETLRNFHQKVETEVRESIPNLPSTAQIARLARSPSALLNTLMDMPADDLEAPVPDPGAPEEEGLIDTGEPITLDSLAPDPGAPAANGHGATAGANGRSAPPGANGHGATAGANGQSAPPGANGHSAPPTANGNATSPGNRPAAFTTPPAASTAPGGSDDGSIVAGDPSMN